MRRTLEAEGGGWIKGLETKSKGEKGKKWDFLPPEKNEVKGARQYQVEEGLDCGGFAIPLQFHYRM